MVQGESVVLLVVTCTVTDIRPLNAGLVCKITRVEGPSFLLDEINWGRDDYVREL